MNTIRTIQMKLIFINEINLKTIRLLFLNYSLKLKAGFLWADVKHGHRHGFTYLRIPDLLIALLNSILMLAS